jgi:hypothetical protein
MSLEDRKTKRATCRREHEEAITCNIARISHRTYRFGIHTIDLAGAVIDRQASGIWRSNYPSRRQCPDQHCLQDYVNEHFPLFNRRHEAAEIGV